MGWLIKFLGGKLVLGLGKAGLMTLINGLVMTVKVAIVGAYITIAIFIFNKFYDLFSKVSSLVNNSTDDTVSWALHVVASMGIWDAFVDTWSLFSPMLISVIVIFLSKKGLTVLDRVHQWAQDVTRINYL